MENHNILIHLYCIPLILITALVLTSYVNLPFTNLTWYGIVGYGTYYIVLDKVAGLVILPLLLFSGFLSMYLQNNYAKHDVLVVTLFFHVVCWLLQFYGHFHFEGKSPAVFDNLLQPLVLAPYFVIFEILFMFGYKKDLEKEILVEAKKMRLNMKK